MTPERWRQITEIFHAALACGPGQREAFVASNCGDDALLRREVESMLAAHQEAGGFGDLRVLARPVNVQSSVGPVALAIGTSLGPYEILSLLGVGGMGAVGTRSCIAMSR
jgi:eukaryotic-like serine/threonine-protein kinase